MYKSILKYLKLDPSGDHQLSLSISSRTIGFSCLTNHEVEAWPIFLASL